MAEEQPTLAEKACAAIRNGQLPSHAPNRRFGGRGNGETSPVCGEVVTLIQAEIELEFNRHGPEAGPGPVPRFTPGASPLERGGRIRARARRGGRGELAGVSRRQDLPRNRGQNY